MQPQSAPLTAESFRGDTDPLHGRVFESRDDAIAAWIEHAGPLQQQDVWVTPTQSFRVLLPMKHPPKFIPFKLVREPGTTRFIARPMNWPWLVRLSQCRPFLGEAYSAKIIARLGEGGFIRMCRITPQASLVDLETLYDHLLATSGESGTEFWTAAAKDRYHEAAAIVR